jgi:hypothetical protein
MKIVYTEGCTAYSLTVDNVESCDCDKQLIKDAIKTLIDKEDDIGTLQQHLEYLVEHQGEFTDLGHCDECGDDIYRYTVEI